MLLIRCAGCDGLAVLGRDGRRRCHTEVLGARSTRWARPKVHLEVLVDDDEVDEVIVGAAGTGAAARRACGIVRVYARPDLTW